MMIRIKRMYDPPAAEDGIRILVDRLWPRGIKREAAQIEEWMKEIAPSDALRRWFAHRTGRWEEFSHRYRQELSQPPRQECLARLIALAKSDTVTLLFSARDPDHNQAVVLREVILEAMAIVIKLKKRRK